MTEYDDERQDNILPIPDKVLTLHHEYTKDSAIYRPSLLLDFPAADYLDGSGGKMACPVSFIRVHAVSFSLCRLFCHKENEYTTQSDAAIVCSNRRVCGGDNRRGLSSLSISLSSWL